MEKRRLANILLLMLAVLAHLTSCSPNVGAISSVFGYDNGIVPNGDGIRMKDFHVIICQIPDSVYIGSVIQIFALEDRYVLHGDRDVCLLDRDGSYLGSVGAKGHGYGEYVSIGSVSVSKELRVIEIYDSYSRNILRYDTDGHFLSVRECSFEGPAISGYDYMPDGSIFGSYYLFRDAKARFFSCDEDFSDKVDVLGSGLSSSAMTPMGIHPYNIRNGVVTMCSPFSDMIYTYNDGEAVPYLQVLSERRVLTDEEKESLDVLLPLYTTKTPEENIMYGFNDIYETEKHIMLNTPYDSYVLIEKSSNSCVRYSNYSASVLHTRNLPLINICGSDEDILIGAETAHMLKNWYRFEPSESDKNLNLLKTIVEKLPDSETVVILTYELE